MRKKSLAAAFSVLFLDNFAFALIFPFFPMLFLEPVFDLLHPATLEKTRNILLGFVLAVYPVAQFFGAPFFGGLADRIGRKKSLLYSLGGSFFGYLLTALAITVNNYIFLLLGWAVSGFFGATLALCLATINDFSPAKEVRGKRISYVAMTLALSWALAILAGVSMRTVLMQKWIHPGVFIGGGSLLFLIAMALLLAFYREKVPEVATNHAKLFKGMHQIIRLLENRHLRVLYLVLIFWVVGLTMTFQWALPISIEKFQAVPTQIVWVFVIYALFWSGATGILNPLLIPRFSIWTQSLWFLFALGLLYFFAGASVYFLYFEIAYALTAIFAGILWGNNITLISLNAKESDQGKAMGVTQSMLSLSQVIGLFFGGLIAGFSIEPIFFMSSLSVVVAFLLLLVYIIRRKTRFAI